MFFAGKAKVRKPVPSRHPDFAGMMRPGHHQSTPFETPEKLPFIVAADVSRLIILEISHEIRADSRPLLQV